MDLEQLGIRLKVEQKYIHHLFGGKVRKPIFNKADKTLKLEISVNNVLPYRLYADLIEKLNQIFKYDTDILMISSNNHLSVKDIQQYFDHFLAEKSRLTNREYLINLSDDNEIHLLVNNEDDKAELSKEFSALQLYLIKVGITNRIKIVESVVKAKVQVVESNSQNTPKVVENKVFDYGAQNHYEKVNIIDLKDGLEKVQIEGEIFKIENRQLKSGKHLQTLTVKDDTGAFVVKRFEGRRHSTEDIFSIKAGNYVNIKGNLQYDAYSKSNNVMADAIAIANRPNVRKDEEEEKRVELHTHSNRSEMDGIPEVSDIINTAYKFGHKAVAITDHMVIQGFPDAYSTLKNLKRNDDFTDFKVLYGTEFNVVEDESHVIRNYSDNENIGNTFIVFDLETTGLSNRYNEIIEFGAVKVTDNQIVDRIQFFVKPNEEISVHISDLTKITNDHVINANSIEDEIDRVLDFFKDDPIVAHNASFDLDFLNATLENLDRPQLNNVVIDTMLLSRLLNPERRFHSLGFVARFYSIPYDGSVAHRADYDAEITANVFISMLSQLKERKINTYTGIMDLVDQTFLINSFDSQMTVIVKEQDGLKDLYELITKSHTEEIAIVSNSESSEVVAVPRLLRSSLNEKRKHLLIGSSSQNGEVFEKALNKSQKALEEEIAFYDYIEVMPPENYRNLVTRFKIDPEMIIKALENIVLTAKRMNKLVVATGDVHYLEPSDKILRDIYINANGIGGVRHPLYIRKETERIRESAPDQHFRTTKEMLEAFTFLPRDIANEIVILNTNKVADMVEEVAPMKERLYTPSIDNAENLLKDICYDTAHNLYGNPLPELVQSRLEKELSKIIQHGFAVIYYISHLLVKRSNEDGYIVGSRGSVGSSFVATMSGITEVNPLPPHYVCPNCHYNEFFLDGSVSSGYDLDAKNCPKCDHNLIVEGQDIPFETFLGFEGDKVPDIDLNFSSIYQEHAHNFTKEIFGDEHVFKAGTIGTVAERTAFGYVLGYEEEMQVQNMSRPMQDVLAAGAEGVKRTTGQHPGGIIVIPSEMDVHDFTPVQYPANNVFSEWKTTHFQYGDIEENVLKLDILGHVDPTAMKLLQDISGINVLDIPMNDKRVMSIFNSTNELNIDDRYYSEDTGAAGLPEFGTPFVRRMLEATKPQNFSDLLIISGLSHGTDVWANNAEELIADGILLNEVIGCRDDIMTFLIQKGLKDKDAFDIMESVRRGRGLTPRWENMMVENDVPEWYITSCKKIKYMFPKAHATAYVIMAVRIAWFKVYYPHYYYISYFSLRANAYEIETMIKGKEAIEERLAEIKNKMFDYSIPATDRNRMQRILGPLEVCLEMYLRGYRFSNIDLYKSMATEFISDPNDEKTIIPPFTTIDGLGANVGQSIVEARKNGVFLSKQDLMSRTQVSKNIKEKLDELNVLEELQEENQLSFF